MDTLEKIFGTSKDLTCLQMGLRGIVVFIIALLLIRLSGRRSFGLRTPLDNIIAVLLGAILSRSVVGASPFVPTIVTCVIIVLLHRVLGHYIARNKAFSRLIEGEKIVLYENGKFNRSHMSRALVCEEDIRQGVRKSALTDDMNKIATVYMERNGEISAIKKDIQ